MLPKYYYLVALSLLLVMSQAQASFTTQLTPAQIEADMQSHFPAKEYAAVARVELLYPRVDLSSQESGITIHLTLLAKMAGQKEKEGKVVLHTGLNYKPASGELFLVDPELVDLEMPFVNGDLMEEIKSTVVNMLRNIIPLIRIYRVKESDLNHSLDKSTLKTYSVADDRLNLEFGFK
jgi:hypothetical protein